MITGETLGEVAYNAAVENGMFLRVATPWEVFPPEVKKMWANIAKTVVIAASYGVKED